EIEEENQNDKEVDFGLVHDSSVGDIVAEASWNAVLTLRSSHPERTVARLMLPHLVQLQSICISQGDFLIFSGRSSVLCRCLLRPGRGLISRWQLCSFCQGGKAAARLPDRASNFVCFSL